MVYIINEHLLIQEDVQNTIMPKLVSHDAAQAMASHLAIVC
jgi:hypothetical protein